VGPTSSVRGLEHFHEETKEAVSFCSLSLPPTNKPSPVAVRGRSRADQIVGPGERIAKGCTPTLSAGLTFRTRGEDRRGADVVEVRMSRTATGWR